MQNLRVFGVKSEVLAVSKLSAAPPARSPRALPWPQPVLQQRRPRNRGRVSERWGTAAAPRKSGPGPLCPGGRGGDTGPPWLSPVSPLSPCPSLSPCPPVRRGRALSPPGGWQRCCSSELPLCPFFPVLGVSLPTFALIYLHFFFTLIALIYT